MKGKLIKTGAEYLLRDINGNTVAITNGSTEGRKLSKQNCDEIFGVVDIEKMALEKASVFGGVVKKPETLTDEQIGYMHGFIEAMELNKDKFFYLQPNEIEVEVEMGDIYIYESGDSNILGSYSKSPNPKYGLPKFDSEGCLILKKI